MRSPHFGTEAKVGAFVLETLTAGACAGTAISIGIGNIYKLYACLGGAQVGIERMAGSAPP